MLLPMNQLHSLEKLLLPPPPPPPPTRAPSADMHSTEDAHKTLLRHSHEMPFRKLLFIPGSVNPRGLPVFENMPEGLISFVYQSSGHMMLEEHIDALVFQKSNSCALCFFKVRNYFGPRILRQAINVGSGQDIADVLALGVDVNTTVCDLGCTPLLYATKLGNLLASRYSSIVKALVDGGGDLNARGPDSFTPLMSAVDVEAQNEYVMDTVSVLLGAGADVTARGISGATALHLSASHRTAGIAQLLIQHGADAYAPDETGKRPIDYFDEFDYHKDFFSLSGEVRDVRGYEGSCGMCDSRSSIPASGTMDRMDFV